VEVSAVVKQRIRNFVDKWLKGKNEKNYVDDRHKTFCQGDNKDDLSLLSKPVVRSAILVQFTVPILSDFDPFYHSSLNLKRVSFTKSVNKIEIGYKVDNYMKNQIYKGNTQNIMYFEDTIDMDWMKAVHEYIKTLSLRDVLIVRGYTNNGDVMSNNYLRGKFSDTIQRYLNYAFTRYI
jgi:hypothetical protein